MAAPPRTPIGRLRALPLLRRRMIPFLGLLLSWALLLLGTTALPGLPGASPALGQPREISSAAIEVDGRQLFTVWSSNDYSAEQRILGPNRRLQQAVEADYPVKISVGERNNLPVITLNGEPLLTVTRRDAPEGLDRSTQAELWRREIETAIERGRLERRPAHVRRMLLVACACLVAAFALQRTLGGLWRRLFRDAWEEHPDEAGLNYGAQSSRFLKRASLRGLQGAVWLGAGGIVANLFPAGRILSLRLVEATADSLASPVLPLGERSYSVLDAIILLALFLLLIKFVGMVQGVLRSRVLQYMGIGVGAQEAVAFIVQFGLLFIGSLVLLQLWGLDLTSLTLFASVLGVGVGLGLQGITKNFISGLIIIFEQPIQVGDFVEVGDLQGTVRRVSLRSTEVVTLDQITMIVPNSEFLESRVINWSHGSPTSRLQIPVSVAYGSDCSKVRNALVEACDGYGGILTNPVPRVFFSGFGDSSLNFHLLVWIDQPKRQYEIMSDLNFRIEAVLRNRGITIPFPQRDLHLGGENLEISLPSPLTEALIELLDRKRPHPGRGPSATEDR